MQKLQKKSRKISTSNSLDLCGPHARRGGHKKSLGLELSGNCVLNGLVECEIDNCRHSLWNVEESRSSHTHGNWHRECHKDEVDAAGDKAGQTDKDYLDVDLKSAYS
jgi:hypothetical protein